MGFLAIRYDDLIENTSNTLEQLINYLELPVEDYIYEIRLEDRRSNWKNKIPCWYHGRLLKETERGRKLLESIDFKSCQNT